MALFKRGYNSVDKEKKRQDEESAKRRSQLWEFYLSGDGDEADIHFLTEEPVTFYAHQVKRNVNGKDKFDMVVCDGKDQYCEEGDRPYFKGAYLIVDHREYEFKDDKGKKKKGRDQVRLYIPGTKVLSQLGRISKKSGLTDKDITVIKLGSGTSSTYMFEQGERFDYDEDEIRELLPENLRKLYDGSEDSLYTIVEEQIKMRLPASNKNNNKDTDEEDEDEDLDEDDGVVYDDDEEDEDDKPARNTRTKSKGLSGKFKRQASNNSSSNRKGLKSSLKGKR